MPESEKPIEKNNRSSSHKRRRFRRNRSQNNTQNTQSQSQGQPQPQGQQNRMPQPGAVPSAQGQQKNQHQPKSHYSERNRNRDHHRNRFREKAPGWTAEEFLKADPLPETKEDLQKILASVDPEELMMAPLFQKAKAGKPSENAPEDGANLDAFPFEEGGSKVAVEMVKNCPICGKIIREVMYALHDYDHDQLAHFDCVFKKITETFKDKLGDQRCLAYLGSGAFGIMEPVPNKPNKSRLVEKIYPGAPVEELLRADENHPDEEI